MADNTSQRESDTAVSEETVMLCFYKAAEQPVQIQEGRAGGIIVEIILCVLCKLL